MRHFTILFLLSLPCPAITIDTAVTCTVGGVTDADPYLCGSSDNGINLSAYVGPNHFTSPSGGLVVYLDIFARVNGPFGLYYTPYSTSAEGTIAGTFTTAGLARTGVARVGVSLDGDSFPIIAAVRQDAIATVGGYSVEYEHLGLTSVFADIPFQLGTPFDLSLFARATVTAARGSSDMYAVLYLDLFEGDGTPVAIMETPEPGTWGLLAAGLVLAAWRRLIVKTDGLR